MLLKSMLGRLVLHSCVPTLIDQLLLRAAPFLYFAITVPALRIEVPQSDVCSIPCELDEHRRIT